MIPANPQSSLAHTLGLKPLDRVMVNSTHELREARAFSRYEDKPCELPWFYFQRAVGDKIEVRTPGGYACEISPLDVCDLIRSEPITVRAMPMAKFMERLAMPILLRQNAADPSFFSEAHVLCAEKGKFGRIDFLVWFTDESLNTNKPIRAVIEGDRRKLISQARRSRMPVSHRTSANHSADHGLAAAAATNRHVVSTFFKSRLTTVDRSSTLLSYGAKPLTTAAINRLP